MVKEKIRTFISIIPPFYVKEEIIKIQQKIPPFMGKVVEPENLHLTLKFLGEIEPSILVKVKFALEEIKFLKFEAEITSLGIFDNFKSERFKKDLIVWLHLMNCGKLQKLIDKKFEGIFPLEKRFMSRLTIARVKSIKNKKIFLDEIKKIKFSRLKFEINQFHLMKSELTSKGSVYKEIANYKLCS